VAIVQTRRTSGSNVAGSWRGDLSADERRFVQMENDASA